MSFLIWMLSSFIYIFGYVTWGIKYSNRMPEIKDIFYISGPILAFLPIAVMNM